MVIVASSRSSADQLVRSFAARRDATVGLYRFSMVQLASHIARTQIAQRGLAPLTRTGAVALALRSIFHVGRSQGFKFFGAVGEKPGFATALAKTVQQLRATGVEASELAALGDRGQDMAALLTEYLGQLRAGKLADIIDVLAIASSEINGGTVLLSVHPILLLDVPIESRAEAHFVEALARRSPAVFATLLEGDTRMISALSKMAQEVQSGIAKATTSLDRLQYYLFENVPRCCYPDDRKVEFFSAPGEGRECVEIARRIQELARQGTQFDRMAIALRSPQSYAPLLEAALERAGIESYFARGTRRPHPSGRALIALLLCAEEKLSAKRFAEYLSLGQVPDVEAGGGPPPAREIWVAANDDLMSHTAAIEPPLAQPPPQHTEDTEPLVAGSLRAPWKWEELLVEAAVVGGRDRWQRRLNGLEVEIARKIESIALDNPDSAQITRLERQRANLGHLRHFALPILQALDQFPKQANWGEWLALLQELATIVLRRPEHVLALLAELLPIANVGPVTLCEVRETLSDRLTHLPVEPPRNPYGRVFIGTPEQLRGRSFDIVFVPGLAERIFPQKLREDPLLLDSNRQALGKPDFPLPSLADRAAEERLRLRILAGAAKEKVFFSYPRVELALARPRVPSFYALDVRRTTLGRLPNIEEFERRAAKNSGAELAWLAPQNPDGAIDDIEYDLAVLRPLLAAAPHTVRGGARYLIELSAELGRSLRNRWLRWQQKWGTADGLCDSTGLTQQQLAPYRLKVRAYSPTSLQAFAACPYKFLLSAIHRLAPREESVALEVLDPLTRGRMYHSVVARFLREALANNMLPVSPGTLENAQSLIEEILSETETEYREQLAPAIQRVWQEDVELLRADLRGWLAHMSEHPDGFVPELIEFAFGLAANPGRDPASTADAARLPDGFLLHGIIDLTEKNENDQRRVTDHKTGKERTRDGLVVGAGEVLQPVLYSLALEDLRKKPISEARLSFCSAVGGYSERTVVMDKRSRHIAGAVLRTIDDAIGRGFLPAAPKHEGCKWCEFFLVCGPHEEMRVSRKDSRALEGLLSIRGTP
ncbi:MAG: PD-(D/E)XK nuclease family protein [Acidobacteria bacterium]|nr:PD-(D/E)XK nuclease family protein [Acidobacteriota bacterium]